MSSSELLNAAFGSGISPRLGLASTKKWIATNEKTPRNAKITRIAS